MREPMPTSYDDWAAWVPQQRVLGWLAAAAADPDSRDAVALRARGADPAADPGAPADGAPAPGAPADGAPAPGAPADGAAAWTWTEHTWAEVADQVARLAGSLARLGVGEGDRVLLFVRNRPQFHVADLACLALRAVPISVYNSSAPEQVAYLAGHSHAVALVADDVDGFLSRVLPVRDGLPDLRHLVVLADPAGTRPDGVHLFDDLVAAGEPVDLAAAAAASRADDLVTVIYTSGTTGEPKGVTVDHANVAWQLAGSSAAAGEQPEGYRGLSYLPMAHVAERMVTHYAWLAQRSTVTCCPDIADLGAYLGQVHPHVFFGPPRVFEKLRSGIQAAVAAMGPQAQGALDKALEVGGAVADLRERGEEPPSELAAAHAGLEAMLMAPLRAKIGLDAAVYAFSGAAPLPVPVALFFRALGVPFSEVYGMSENTGGMTWSPYANRAGWVGRPFLGAEVRLGDDGEVLCRGGIVSRGYLDDPARTAETFDADGWLHTGDIGEIDADGYLRIVDRKKELIITAGGKNVAPAQLEARLKSHPLVGQACVAGDNRPYLVALLVLDPEAAPMWAAAHGVAAVSGGAGLAAIADDPAVRAELDALVEEVNAHVSHAEGIKRYAVLADEWMPDSPQLTATMKLKRRGVLGAYADTIEGMYAGTG